jgi:hypothetical protein
MNYLLGDVMLLGDWHPEKIDKNIYSLSNYKCYIMNYKKLK